MTKLPSQKLTDLLSGVTPYEDADPSIQSWARFEIHQGALDVLAQSTKEKRRAMLQRIPAGIRELVEAEALRVWAWRRS